MIAMKQYEWKWCSITIIYLFSKNSKQVIGKEAHKGYVNKDKEPYQSRMGRIAFKVFSVDKQLICAEAKEKDSSKDEYKGN